MFHESRADSSKHRGLLPLVIKEIIGGSPQGIQPASEDRLPLIHYFQRRVEEGGGSHQLWVREEGKKEGKEEGGEWKEAGKGGSGKRDQGKGIREGEKGKEGGGKGGEGEGGNG